MRNTQISNFWRYQNMLRLTGYCMSEQRQVWSRKKEKPSSRKESLSEQKGFCSTESKEITNLEKMLAGSMAASLLPYIKFVKITLSQKASVWKQIIHFKKGWDKHENYTCKKVFSMPYVNRSSQYHKKLQLVPLTQFWPPKKKKKLKLKKLLAHWVPKLFLQVSYR